MRKLSVINLGAVLVSATFLYPERTQIFWELFQRRLSYTLSVLVPATFLYPVRTRLASPLIRSAPNSAPQNTATPSTEDTTCASDKKC